MNLRDDGHLYTISIPAKEFHAMPLQKRGALVREFVSKQLNVSLNKIDYNVDWVWDGVEPGTFSTNVMVST